ncbi:conserved Plasmodium protein, unknown function [Plasmodium vivax]|uniref:(malaria parasite P. vivax) hypothetical protein n=1 Tax=Plasmodium vivax TaxID=5855 RepID=A0A1G4GR78_PLAVI|nr:unnamed protein product [Plasmodium vivax]CAI7717883.1 conserved protein, unknown function [Plasmodium vivax]SCO65091.1 conserved Plasmodium protein, unknown function [Plasmodium vivax]SCO70584.1 conserved Plasmodium protein, unknown function [Plasmodium vivax]VUZ93273.1 conserved protein, unknown function [Plasmodium vivax]
MLRPTRCFVTPRCISEPTGRKQTAKMGKSCNAFDLFMHQYIVKYKSSKVCYLCKNKVTANHVEKMEDVCPQMWRHLHGLTMQPQCPLQSFGQVLRVKDLRFEELEKYRDALQRK